MATHLIVRICAIAAAIGICSIATLAEPISMSAKLNSVSTFGVRSQADSAFLLQDQAIALSGANSLSDVELQSPSKATGFLVSANMPNYAGSFDKARTAYSITPGVPEPSAMLLFGSGLLAALGYRARRKLTKSA